MKAVLFHGHGGREVLKYQEIDTPEPGQGEVRVKVSACALNHLDIWIRNGIPSYQLPMPHISGCDVSGEVDACGLGVTGWKKGARVIVSPGLSCWQCANCKSGNDNICDTFKIFGAGTQGGYAEYCLVRDRDLIALPDTIGDEEAAAFPLTYLTAWHMLFNRAQLEAGQSVLIMGANSGVGAAAVQIAKWKGARVIVTARGSEKRERVRTMGATEIIDPETNRIRDKVKEFTNGRGVDVVFEHIGGPFAEEALASLAKGGRVVTCGATAGPSLTIDLRFFYMRQLSFLGSIMGCRRELEELLPLIASRQLRPTIDRMFPLSEAAEAQKWMEDRNQFGKILLLPD